MGATTPYHERRPAEPDPRVLSEGLEAMASILGVERTTIRWDVGPRVDRPRSTLFLLRAVAASRVIAEAHYKNLYPPGFGGPARFSERAPSLHAELARSADLTGRLYAIAAHHGIRPSRVLAVDPGGLTLITERIKGTAIGNSLYRAVTPRGRAAGLSIAKLIGTAVRLIEQTSLGVTIEEPGLSPKRIGRQIETAREGGILSKDDSVRLRALMHGLYQEARNKTAGVVYTHGDLTSSNVLRTANGIGLIDFSWRAQLRAYDLAKLAVLLESVPYPRPAWTAALLKSLVEGYGDPETTRSPGWRLVRLQQHLGIVMRMHRPSSRRRRSHRRIGERALKSIRSELKAAGSESSL